MSTKDEGLTVSQNGQQTDVRRSALDWWEELFYTQRVKEVVITLGCDSGIIGGLSDADIELLYVNRSK